METLFPGSSFESEEEEIERRFLPALHKGLRCLSQMVFTSLLISFIIAAFKRDGGGRKSQRRRNIRVDKESKIKGLACRHFPAPLSMSTHLYGYFCLIHLSPFSPSGVLVCTFSPSCQAESYRCQL